MKLSFDPYAYVRITVMKTFLLKREDYHRLMKMKFEEIAKYISDTDYREEITQLALKYNGADLIEHALNQNLVKKITKIKLLVDENTKQFIDIYLLRWDLFNIKTILRGKFTNEKYEIIESLLVPLGTLDQKKVSEMLKKENVEAALPLLDIDRKEISKIIQVFKEKKNLGEVENLLDRYYYKTILEKTKTIPKAGALLKEFLLNEIDVLNLTNLLRLKKLGISSEEIKKYIIDYEESFLKHIKNLAGLSLEQSITKLRRAAFYPVLLEIHEKKESLTVLETQLNNYLLKRSNTLLHKNPMSVDIILSYIFAKEIEIKNLKTLIRGKQLGIPDEIIEKELVAI